jgi:glutathione S-transferase
MEVLFQLTYADLVLVHTLAFFNRALLPGYLMNYPRLSKFAAMITALPNIKAWMHKRPKTAETGFD